MTVYDINPCKAIGYLQTCRYVDIYVVLQDISNHFLHNYYLKVPSIPVCFFVRKTFCMPRTTVVIVTSLLRTNS